LPARLPPGETILWQGAPRWRGIAWRAYHVGQVGAYFGLLLLWSAASAAAHGTLANLPQTALLLTGLGAGAIAVLVLLAWLTGRTTLYTITNRRVVIRFGIALPMTINLPFRQIASAGLRLHADGSGDIPLALLDAQRVAYLVLWPHVRPWRAARAEPMLRAVPDAQRVAQLLARALAAAAAQPAPANPDHAAAAGRSPHAPVAA
jgi:hypothetical protein